MHQIHKFALFVVAASFGGLAAGCGGTTDPATDPPVTTVGQAVFTAAVRTVVAKHDGGGFRPAPPAGSKCNSGAGTYTLTVATQGLAWVKCLDNGTMPTTETSGSRTLTTAEFKDLSATLEKLKVVTATACGADKPNLSMTITTAVGSQDYGDSFYGCTIKDRPLLESQDLSSALEKFRMLAM